MYLYVCYIFSTCVALYHIQKIVEMLWCLLAYVVFAPQGGREEADYIC